MGKQKTEVKYIYGIKGEYDDEYELVSMEVTKETPKCFWLARHGGVAFNYRKRIYREDAFETAEEAITAYRDRLMRGVRSLARQLSNANSDLDRFNATFKGVG